ncbi:MAG: hypothetical protein AAGI17_09245 [Planctomycetota bacterium]
MKLTFELALISAGAALILMPQIHNAVYIANISYARAIALTASPPQELPMNDLAKTGTLGIMSATLGAVCLLGAGTSGLIRVRSATPALTA